MNRPDLDTSGAKEHDLRYANLSEHFLILKQCRCQHIAGISIEAQTLTSSLHQPMAQAKLALSPDGNSGHTQLLSGPI